MDDIKVFLNWYLNPRTRMKRGLFNVVFFLAFVPVLFIKVIDMAESTGQKADEYAPVMNMLKQGLSGGNNYDTLDVEGVLRQSENTRDATRELMSALDFQSFGKSKPAPTKQKSFNLGEVLNFFIYIALVPIVMMRLRDLGKWGDSLYLYTGLAYSGIFLDIVKSLFGFNVPLLVTSAAGVLSFVLISWLCMGASRKRKRDLNKDDNYMPGDRPDDPF